MTHGETGTDVEATQQARERLRQLGLAEGTLGKVHVHAGSSPHTVEGKEAGRPQKGLPLALPLVHVLNYLQDRPPWCCFAPDPAQVPTETYTVLRHNLAFIRILLETTVAVMMCSTHLIRTP